MSTKSSRTFRAHLALRLLGVGALVALLSASALYRWQSDRDLRKSIETIRHFSTFIAYESIAINLDGGNIVFVEDALRKLSDVRPILYSYVLDRDGRVVATSAEVKSYGPCCFPWEPPLSSRPGGDFTLDVEATRDGELSDTIKVARGDRLVLIGIPIVAHSGADRVGTLTVAVSGAEALAEARSAATRLALLLFCLELVVGLPATLLLSKRLARPITRMRLTLEHSAAQAGANESLIRRLRAESSPESIEEFDLLRERLLELHEAIETQQTSLQKAYAAASLGELASQLAHDIRSPLAALNAALENPTGESQKLVRGAIQSIRGIAQGLLEKNRALSSETRPMTPAPEATLSAESLPLLLEKTVVQKTAQLRERRGLELTLSLGAGAYACFALVDPIELERVVSNLVDNAAEAIEGEGRITVALAARAGMARVEVRDTGRGIAAELLPRLGERGLTVGKKDGSGLGLFHARTTIAACGGKLSIESKVGQGTSVAFELATTEPPAWFAKEIEIPPSALLVLADDDETTHALWSRRLDAAGVPAARRVHAKTPDDVVAWFRSNVGADALYLCDYEFKGCATNGLDLIERLGIGGTAILVTGHADDARLRARCVKFGVLIAPKSLMGIIPIRSG